MRIESQEMNICMYTLNSRTRYSFGLIWVSIAISKPIWTHGVCAATWWSKHEHFRSSWVLHYQILQSCYIWTGNSQEKGQLDWTTLQNSFWSSLEYFLWNRNREVWVMLNNGMNIIIRKLRLYFFIAAEISQETQPIAIQWARQFGQSGKPEINTALISAGLITSQHRKGFESVR